MYNYEASFFVWLTEPLYLTKFQKAAICVRDFQGVRDTTLTLEGKKITHAEFEDFETKELHQNRTRENGLD